MWRARSRWILRNLSRPTFPASPRKLKVFVLLKALGINKTEEIRSSFLDETIIRNDVLINIENLFVKTEKEALDAAKKYLTSVNCTNALTQDEVKRAAEAFMMIKKGDTEECFMGVLDGKDWYMTYPKDIVKNAKVVHTKGDPVSDSNYYELEGKTEVAVREVRGT